jgi:hypothetical protein
VSTFSFTATKSRAVRITIEEQGRLRGERVSNR